MPAGRPKFKIDYETAEKLAGIMATQEEIATFLGCSVDTLQRDEKFCGIYKKGQETGKMSLRRWQFESAKKGNVTMQVWLGKNYLGQKDNVEVTDNTAINKNIQCIADLINKPKPNRTEEDLAGE